MKKKFLLLRCEMLRHDLDGATLATVIGISGNSLSQKLRGLYPFTAAEMKRISAILGIPPERYYEFFVADFGSDSVKGGGNNG